MKSKVLKLATLVELGACESQTGLFKEKFGESVRVTEKLCEKVAALFDLNWAARHLLTAPARAEYERVRAPACAEYERVRAQACAQFERVRAPACAEYERVRAPACAQYERVRAPARAQYERVTAPARAQYDRVTAQARAECQRVMAPAFAKLYIGDPIKASPNSGDEKHG